MMKASRKRTHLSTHEYWDLVVEAVEHDDWDIHSSVRDHKVRHYRIESDDSEWCNRVRSFEIQVSVRSNERLRAFSHSFSSGFSPSNTYDRVKCWSKTFMHLDPRQQIHHFHAEAATRTSASSCIEAHNSMTFSRQSLKAMGRKHWRKLNAPKTVQTVVACHTALPEWTPSFAALVHPLEQVFASWQALEPI